MKFKYKIKRTLQTQPGVLEEKVTTYLIKNSYRITEKGPGYIIFIEDEFSDRRRARSDFHTRIGEGKFIFNNVINDETSVELIYLTSVSYYVVLVILACAFGVYTSTLIMPIVFSIALAMPILYRIFYLNSHVFNEIMEC